MAIPYTQALLDQANAYVGRPLNERRYAAGLDQISALYGAITGEAVGTCKQCQYSDYLDVVNNYIRLATRFLHPETMPDSKFTFAPAYQSETISDSRYAKSVTAENLTDEDAETLIRYGYGHVIVSKTPADAVTSSEQADEDGEPELSERETQFEQKLTAATTALEAEQDAHAKTSNELAAEKAKTAELTTKLTKSSRELQAANARAAKVVQPVTPVQPFVSTSSVDSGVPASAPDVPAEPLPATGEATGTN